jgi:hypothetical protein
MSHIWSAPLQFPGQPSAEFVHDLAEVLVREAIRETEDFEAQRSGLLVRVDPRQNGGVKPLQWFRSIPVECCQHIIERNPVSGWINQWPLYEHAGASIVAGLDIVNESLLRTHELRVIEVPRLESTVPCDSEAPPTELGNLGIMRRSIRVVVNPSTREGS